MFLQKSPATSLRTTSAKHLHPLPQRPKHQRCQNTSSERLRPLNFDPSPPPGFASHRPKPFSSSSETAGVPKRSSRTGPERWKPRSFLCVPEREPRPCTLRRCRDNLGPWHKENWQRVGGWNRSSKKGRAFGCHIAFTSVSSGLFSKETSDSKRRTKFGGVASVDRHHTSSPTPPFSVDKAGRGTLMKSPPGFWQPQLSEHNIRVDHPTPQAVHIGPAVMMGSRFWRELTGGDRPSSNRSSCSCLEV